MVASSTTTPSTINTKLPSSSPVTTTLIPRRELNPSSSGAFSETSKSYNRQGDSSHSLSSASSSHYVVRCNVNSNSSVPTTATTSVPRVKVTVQQPSITTSLPRFDSLYESVSSSKSSIAPSPPPSSYLKTPSSNILPGMTTSTTSSTAEFSISGGSSVEDSDELISYDQYLSPHGRQSNPSPELRKKTFDDWTKSEQRSLLRSKSEINTIPITDTQQQTIGSQIKAVSKNKIHLHHQSRNIHFLLLMYSNENNDSKSSFNFLYFLLEFNK